MSEKIINNLSKWCIKQVYRYVLNRRIHKHYCNDFDQESLDISICSSFIKEENYITFILNLVPNIIYECDSDSGKLSKIEIFINLCYFVNNYKNKDSNRTYLYYEHKEPVVINIVSTVDLVWGSGEETEVFYPEVPMEYLEEMIFEALNKFLYNRVKQEERSIVKKKLFKKIKKFIKERK